MSRILTTALALGVCVMLPSVSKAQSGNPPGDVGQAMEAVRAKLVLQINEKQRKAKNKACGPGKVFVEDQGCVKREKAEKEKAKAKEEEKAKQAQPAQTPKSDNFCCSATTTQNGGGGFTSCASTEAEARKGAEKSAQQTGIPASAIKCNNAN